jgi:hypothetical protein
LQSTQSLKTGLVSQPSGHGTLAVPISSAFSQARPVAIRGDSLAVDPTILVREKCRDHRSDVVRHADTPKRGHLYNALVEFGVVAHHAASNDERTIRSGNRGAQNFLSMGVGLPGDCLEYQILSV